MGGFGGASIQKAQSLIDLGSSSSTSSTASLSGNSPKTGPSEWAVPQPSRLKYRQKFNSLDKSMSGYLSGEWQGVLRNLSKFSFPLWGSTEELAFGFELDLTAY